MHQLPSYRTAPARAPSLFNREAVLGVVAGFGLLFAGIIAPPLAVPLAAVGAGVGAIAGRQRMKRESETGVVVRPPTFWNFGLVLGVTAGLVAAMLLVPVFGLAGSGIGMFFGAAKAVGMAAAAIAPLLAIGSGALLGAGAYERRMQAEYVQARDQGEIVPETRQPSPLDIPKNAPAVPAMAQGPVAKLSVPNPPAHYGEDAKQLRNHLDEEMKRRAMPKTQYPFNGR